MASTYAHAESNIWKTWIYLTGFIAILIGFGWLVARLYAAPDILYIAVFISLVMSVASYWFSDSIALNLAHAKQADSRTHPELARIVENLAIAAGLPTPKVYVIDEASPNAFATGRDPRHAAVAVTRGLLEHLDKPELEGVIAHELAHIGNRDTLIATVAVVLAGAISLIANLFLRGRLGGRRSDRESSGGILLIVGIIAAVLAPLAATLIRLAISRKREFLADATGALVTRYPEGLARALEKISLAPAPMRAPSSAIAHLWFSSAEGGKRSVSWYAKIFSTHPPAEERIRALRAMSR